MVEAVGRLNTRLEREYGVHLAVRLGIHTGLVVVGEIGSGGQQEQLALGETPNIAARLQGLAAPDTVVISEATAHLIHGYFVCQPLGAQALKGLPQPLQVYRVLQESGAQTRLDIVTPRGLTHWSAGTKKWDSCSGAGTRPPQGWGRWCCSAARRVLANPAWCRC